MSNEFMQEMLDMGHMIQIPRHLHKDTSENAFYMPILSVFRKDAVTTKLRNVFNASAKSSNGTTLNDQILPGPKLQTHIFDVVTKSRNFRYIYSSDVAKMFRQISIPEKDRTKFRIIWRPSPHQPLMEFYLTTVVFGVDCSPWQAIRTLAEDNAIREDTKTIIREGTYMDDILWGADSIRECKEQIKDVTMALSKGKMELTKWMANDPDVLSDVAESRRIDAYIDMSKEEATVKTLGLVFHPVKDVFSYKIKEIGKIAYTKEDCCQKQPVFGIRLDYYYR